MERGSGPWNTVWKGFWIYMHQFGFMGAGRFAEACSRKASGPCGSSVGFLCWTLMSSNTCCQWWILARCFWISISFLWSSFFSSDASWKTKQHIHFNYSIQRFKCHSGTGKSYKVVLVEIMHGWIFISAAEKNKFTSFSTCSGFCTDSCSLFWRKKHSVCLATSRNFCIHWSTPEIHNRLNQYGKTL